MDESTNSRYLNKFNEYMENSIPELKGRLKTDYTADDKFVQGFNKHLNDSFIPGSSNVDGDYSGY